MPNHTTQVFSDGRWSIALVRGADGACLRFSFGPHSFEMSAEVTEVTLSRIEALISNHRKDRARRERPDPPLTVPASRTATAATIEDIYRRMLDEVGPPPQAARPMEHRTFVFNPSDFSLDDLPSFTLDMPRQAVRITGTRPADSSNPETEGNTE